MNNRVSVITYHFVRRLGTSPYPRLKALDTACFEEQLEYLRSHYHLVSMEDCFQALKENISLPPRAALLTFDDAYSDHYQTVFPRLRQQGIPASFFPCAKAVEQNEVLDFNKIHFILASQPDLPKLTQDIFDCLDRHREFWSLESNHDYWTRLAQPFRYDGKEVIFIKRLLQRELPQPLRRLIVGELFSRYVTHDEVTFARELYLSVDQLSEMVREGMSVGSHGYDHHWLEQLNPLEQQLEIDKSLRFLQRLNQSTESWAIAYPFGSYNESLLEIARGRGAVLGFTTAIGIAALDRQNALLLPRLDTNEFPRDRTAAPNAWTRNA